MVLHNVMVEYVKIWNEQRARHYFPLANVYGKMDGVTVELFIVAMLHLCALARLIKTYFYKISFSLVFVLLAVVKKH